MTHIVIIGGSDAGISAARRARELDPALEITVIAADAYPAYSICGLPFLLSGETADWRALAHHRAPDLEQQGIRLLLNRRAEGIDAGHKSVRTVTGDGQVQVISYDKLLIATGAESARPPIEGLDRPGIFFLRWMADGLAMQDFIAENRPRRAVIIGGGYIGLEMADALKRRSLEVTVLEFLPEVLATMDPDMGVLIRQELESNGVKVVTGRAVRSIESKDGGLLVHAADGAVYAAEMVLAATGVRPSARLAESAGLATGAAGAIRVDRLMAANVPDIYAAGDCAETWHRLLGQTYLPLGTTAHKQGRTAGENLAGGRAEFQGSLGTQAVKIFNRIAAGTGLRDAQAAKAGFSPLSITLNTIDRNRYHPGAAAMTVRLTGDRGDGRLLGAQIVGSAGSEIAKRIDGLAAALYGGLRVKDIPDIDLSYSPPLSSPWDPVQQAALAWLKAAKI